MKLSEIFGRACCTIGLHKWDREHVTEGPKKTWAGLCSMWEYAAQAGKRGCVRDSCEAEQDVARHGMPGGGDSKWARASAKKVAEIAAMEDADKVQRCIFHRHDKPPEPPGHHGCHHHH